jgi:polyisoprenoid-binding protein YceI
MNKKFKTLIPVIFAVTMASTASYAAGTGYLVGQDVHNANKVSFSSSATMVSFTGSTSNVQGNASVDLKNLPKSTGEIKVDLSSMDTGIKRRNEHMKGLLNTAENTFAVFKLKKLNTSLKTLPPYKPVFVNASGDLTFNRVTRPVSTVLELTYMPEMDKNIREGNWIHMVASFDLKLSDHGVKAPQLIPMKVNDTVKIDVDVMGMQK